MYKLNFYPLSGEMSWHCDAPRHDAGPRVVATTMRMIVLAGPMERGEIIVHSADYCCDECRARIEADLEVPL
jgi:hypothetical protein